MKLTTAVISLLFSVTLFAQDGYEIKVTLKPFKNEWVYLGHYYGSKQLPIVDSVKLNDKSEAVFKGSKKLGGGIYLVGYPDRTRTLELLLDKNQHFQVIADTSKPQDIQFVNSPENTAFQAYQKFMVMHGRAIDSLNKLHDAASASIKDQVKSRQEAITKYRMDIMTKDPNGILSVLLKAMKDPEVPADAAEAKSDSTFAYRYYKAHYWDGVDFFDERLVRTPFFEGRVDRYYEQLVYPSADSVIKEMDWMLGTASVNEEMQKFLLLKFVNRYYNQKYMWEDKVFVHLFEKYFSQKQYPWLTDKGVKMITDRAYSLMSNIFGSPAADVALPDLDGKQKSLYSINAPYTLLVIWDPTCGHCKELVPSLDTLYKTKWKALGLQPYALAKETEGTEKDWRNFIDKNGLSGWVHVYYSKAADKARIESGIPGYSQLFDVQSFPTLYLLDKDKRIIAKKITKEQIDEILEYRRKNGK
ncbi:MAG TPA: thioredoxin-like domain-containing protein [Chitinophagaceae bacterium]